MLNKLLMPTDMQLFFKALDLFRHLSDLTPKKPLIALAGDKCSQQNALSGQLAIPLNGV